MKKQYRLKKSNEIGKIVQNRQRVGSSIYNLYYSLNQEDVKIAVVVGKKCGKAHNRNYLKRVTREILRPYLKQLKNIHAVIVAKETINNVDFQYKKQTINKMIKQLLERIKQNEKI